MPKKIFKKYAPHPDRVKNMKGLGFLAKWIANPNLWHIHRHNTAKAFANGLFWMAIPIPSQMVTSAITAILIRANLPLSVALVWISNPLTMPPIFYFNYLVGTWILGANAQESLHFEMSWQWITTTLGELWMPLYLGSFVVGTVLAISSYFGLHLFWKIHVRRSWEKRMQQRREPPSPPL
ncbi:MAG: DUF2062 domain-containing protein [Hydrogenovibrio sp.]